MPAPESSAAASPARDIYTVSRLNLEARRVIESDFPPIWVEGELSNVARPRSGHLYFSLKDGHCQVRCAMFRMHNRYLEFEPDDGMQVLAQARVSLYPERGEFQLLVQHLEEAGAGALHRAFEALKRRLSCEGLFDAAHKQALPAVPGCIGIVTSPTGAALRDILTILGRRFPGVNAIVYPTPVQGSSAARGVARMLDLAAARDECDVLIVARGGGSLEDLWPFNEESVARAIHRCPIPVVTGIGHEVDFTIADFVADLRAPTPSAAAELVTPDVAGWRTTLGTATQRLRRHMHRQIGDQRERLAWLNRGLAHPERRLQDLAQRLDELAARALRSVHSVPTRRQSRLSTLTARLYQRAPASVLQAYQVHAAQLSRRLYTACLQYLAERRTRVEGFARAVSGLGPQQTLERGYAIVTRVADGLVLRASAESRAGDEIEARLARGRLRGQVTDVRED